MPPPVSNPQPNPARPAAAFLLAVALGILLASALHAQDFSHPDTQPAPQAALIQQANDALAASDFPTALKILTNLNTQTPNNPQVLYDLGLTLEALDNPSPTADPALTPESCYRQAIAASPAFPAPHVALGLLLARTNRAAEARTQLTTATTLPDTEPALKARAFRALARLDLNGGPANSPPNLAAASDALLTAIKLTSELPEDVLLSAEIAEASADLPAAERAYRRYLALPEGAADPQAIASLAQIGRASCRERV